MHGALKPRRVWSHPTAGRLFTEIIPNLLLIRHERFVSCGSGGARPFDPFSLHVKLRFDPESVRVKENDEKRRKHCKDRF